MLDLLCSCGDNFAAIEHLGLISAVSGGLYLLVLASAIYLQYVMVDANARCAYAPVAPHAPSPATAFDADEHAGWPREWDHHTWLYDRRD